MTKWEFLPNPGREEEGLGHAGIETFKGSRYPSLARECSQNSLDAKKSETVLLHFRHHLLPADQIPDLRSLKKTLEICLEQAGNLRRNKDEIFFRRALHVANQPQIPVLSVEDFGTTGLVGPATSGNPFYALVKSSGVSQKPMDDAGGSFGIGKNAVFAVSDLRTVLYSTLYECPLGKGLRLAQGKSVLVSHGSDDDAKRATGYWGNDGFEPVENNKDIPVWLRREDVGTTVAAIGFTEESDWHWKMVESLIRNFFAAIMSEAIQFIVQRSEREIIEIDAKTLPNLFLRQEVQSAAEMAGTTEELKFSADMMMALSSPAITEQVKEFNDVGTFRLRILQMKGLQRRVGILRNGMYVVDNLRPFGHALSRFPLSKDFVAVLEPVDSETSGVLRDLESPKHDEFSADRIDDPVRRDKLRRAMKNVGKWVREVIKSETEIAATEEILLDEMNQFFSGLGEHQEIPDASLLNDDPEKVKILSKKIKFRPIGSGEAGDSGSSGGEKKSKTKGGQTSGAAKGKGRGLQGGRGGKNFAYRNLRNSVQTKSNGAVRFIAFTPESSGTALLELSAVGVHADEALVIEAIDGKPCAKAPAVILEENERLSMTVRFSYPYTGPINMVLSSIEGGG